MKILIGIRGDLSDRLFEIQKVLGYSLHPSQVHRLEKFAPEQAAEVLRVIAETEKWSFNTAFVQEMARDELAGLDGKVAPVEVQVLAQMVSREPSEENRRLDRAAFQRLGGVDGLLGRSLQRSLDAIPRKSDRDRALEVLLALTDLDRNVRSRAVSISQLQEMVEKVHGSPSEVEAAVAWLSDSRLITPGDGDGVIVYELAHERLIPALRQVANRELSDANKANLLLDRRVNEWLGSGKNHRYLFSLKELWLLRQQWGFLEWGTQRGQKQELLHQSWKQVSWTYGLIATPIMLLLGFGVWSYTPPGQIQWTRWNLVIMANMRVLPSNNNVNQDLETALNLDMVAGVRNHPFPNLWLDWFALEYYSTEELSKIIKVISNIKDRDSAKNLLLQVEIVVENCKQFEVKSQMFSDISQVWITFGETQKAQQILSQALETTKTIRNEYTKVRSLSATADSFSKLGDSVKGKQILSQALETTKTMQDEYAKVWSLSAIADASSKLGDSVKGKQILSQALETTRTIQNEYAKVQSLSAITQAYLKLEDRTQAQDILNVTTKIVNSFQSYRGEKEVAQLHAELGNWSEALRLAQHCDGEDKVAVFARILRVHAEQKHPEFRALRNNKEENE